MTTHKYTRKHYHLSNKNSSPVHADSSYELRVAILLDENPDIVMYEDHLSFITDEGKTRIIDFLVTFKNGDKKLIEVKPLSRIGQFQEQIEDNRKYAIKNGWLFEVWTETDLGFENSNQITAWADQYIKEHTGIDYQEVRKQKNCLKVKRHYRKKIATDKMTFYCEFCKEKHTALRLTYDKNLARNGRYICEREGGHIAGSKPKLHLRKENPYAESGKKQCLKCKNILDFEHFGKDSFRKDGYASKCKECRRIEANLKYQAKKSSN